MEPTPLPPTSVELPLGILDPDNGVKDTAEVRELNGYDEEALAKAGGGDAGLQTILERAVVSIGGEKVTRDLLDLVPLGDRLELLLAIRRATWGDIIEWRVNCPECSSSGDPVTVQIPISGIPRKGVADKSADRYFTVALRSDTANLTVPSGKLHRSILSGSIPTAAEMATGFISDCLVDLVEADMLGMSTVKGMSMADRATLIEEIANHIPGPLLEEVKATCPRCSCEFPLSLTIGALFPL